MNKPSITLTAEQLVKFIAAAVIAPDALGELDERDSHQRFVHDLANVVADNMGLSAEVTDGGEIRFSLSDHAEAEGADLACTGLGHWAAVKDACVYAVTARLAGDDDDSLFVYNTNQHNDLGELARLDVLLDNDIEPTFGDTDEDGAPVVFFCASEQVSLLSFANVTALRALRGCQKDEM